MTVVTRVQVTGRLPRIVLDPHSPLPLYHQLAVRLEQLIMDGSLTDRCVLSEAVLVRHVQVSRHTVKRALRTLTSKGLVDGPSPGAARQISRS